MADNATSTTTPSLLYEVGYAIQAIKIDNVRNTSYV